MTCLGEGNAMTQLRLGRDRPRGRRPGAFSGARGESGAVWAAPRSGRAAGSCSIGPANRCGTGGRRW